MFELESEFASTNELTEAQVTAINGHVNSNVIPDIKKGYDDDYNDRVHNGAEAVIKGAADAVEQKTGLKRNDNEKVGDFLLRSAGDFFTKREAELAQKQSELDEKLKSGNTDQTLVKENQDLKQKISDLQKFEVDFEKAAPFEEKYNALFKEHEELQLDVAFGSVKPSKPDSVNKYEYDAKWRDFEKKVLSSNNLKKVDGKWIAIDKENQHRITPLEDMVKSDENVTKMLEGRQQTGFKDKERPVARYENVPFDVPKQADAKERTKLINEHLDKQGVPATSKERARQFSELNSAILAAKPKS